VSGREWRRVVGIAYRWLDKQSSAADDPVPLFLIAFRTESTPESYAGYPFASLPLPRCV